MDRILELLGAALDTFTPESLAAKLAELDADALAELTELLATEATALIATPTAENVAAATVLADTRDVVLADATRRETEAAEAQAAADAIAARLAPSAGTEGDPDPDAETDPDPEADPEPAPAADPAPAAPAEPTAVVPAAPVPIAAAAVKPSAAKPTSKPVAVTKPRPVLAAAAGVPGFAAGGVLGDRDALARATAQVISGLGRNGHALIASEVVGLNDAYPTSHRLTGDPITDKRLMRDARQERQAILAAGGLCSPTAAKYDRMVIASTARPVRDEALAQFDASRGGLRYEPSPTLGSLAAAITTWTEANDADETPSPAEKACLHVGCEDIVEVKVTAQVACLTFGNYNGQFEPEKVAANNDLLVAEHARIAEQYLLARIDATNTAVTAGAVGGYAGALRDQLALLGRAVAGMRSRERVAPEESPIRAIFPDWFFYLGQADGALAMPGDSTLGLTKADIEGFLEARNVRVTWTLDSQVFAAETAGALNPFPSTVVSRLYFEGTKLFLDGGRLAVTALRDSTLNSVNDYQEWWETFEEVAHDGPQGLTLTSDLCLSGASAGNVEPLTCS